MAALARPRAYDHPARRRRVSTQGASSRTVSAANCYERHHHARSRHVHGRPAAGVDVLLERRATAPQWETGRPWRDRRRRPRSARWCLPARRSQPATYRLVFHTRPYFQRSRHDYVLSPRRRRVRRRRAGKRTTMCPCCSARLATARIAGRDAASDFKPSKSRRMRSCKKANAAVARSYPGETGDRQPVHTVYGGAHLFTADLAPKLGRACAGGRSTSTRRRRQRFAKVLGLFDARRCRLCHHHSRTRRREASSASRSKTFGSISRTATATGPTPRKTATPNGRRSGRQGASRRGTLPPFIGIRIKPLSRRALHARSLRTLDVFVTTLARATRRRLPPNFVITVPKLMTPAARRVPWPRRARVLERRLRLRARASCGSS